MSESKRVAELLKSKAKEAKLEDGVLLVVLGDALYEKFAKAVRDELRTLSITDTVAIYDELRTEIQNQAALGRAEEVTRKAGRIISAH